MKFSIPIVVVLSILAYRAPSLAGSGITDPDYYWHVGYGEWIIRHGKLPDTDFWSWTVEGHPYRLTQWLGEVFMGLANGLGGVYGTSLLAATLVCLTISASYRAARFYLENRLAALAVAVGCNTVLISLACRPHQFTHLSLALLTWVLASFQFGNRKAIYWLPPLFAIWVNLHGGYAFGLAYLSLVCMFSAVEAYMRRDIGSFKDKTMPMIVITVCSVVATLLNPYGWGAWEYAIQIANLKSSSAGIVDEWAPTNIKTEVGLSFYFVVAALSAAMASSSKRPSVSNLLSAMTLVAIGWMAVRLSLMVTVLMVPLLAYAVRGTALYELAFSGEANKYDRLISIKTGIGAIAITFFCGLGMSLIDTTTGRFMAMTLPVDEVAFMKRNSIGGRILNTPESGGFLIREMGTKVSIDTRLDLYGDRALFEWLFAMRGDAGWKEYIARLDPDVVLLNNPSPLRHLLAEAGNYRPVFEGTGHTVLVRNGSHTELPSIQLVPVNQAILEKLKS